MILVDVVNFNADASCLGAKKWLEILQDKENSTLYRWLKLYVKLQKKVVLGLTGATIADIVIFNPQCIELINKHSDIFEIIWRPFAHDIALLRSNKGFLENIEWGWKTIVGEFDNVQKYFLPPEFMITNEQIALLAQNNTKGIFIYPKRFSLEIQQCIPKTPYSVKGVLGHYLQCFPFDSVATKNYLDTLHSYNSAFWNDCLLKSSSILFTWRDGESSFFIPNGLTREEYWLSHEHKDIERKYIKEVENSGQKNENPAYKFYPVHSFSAWMKELRMLGFIKKVQDIEENLESLSMEQKFLWLQLINSDILSAIEKNSLVFKMSPKPQSELWFEYYLKRSERGFEGEDYLAIFKNLKHPYFSSSQEPHMKKLRARMQYLKTLSLGK